MSMRDVLVPYAQEPDKFKIRRPPREVGCQPNRMYEVWEAPKLQSEILVDSHNQLLVDYVGRYETLPQDFQHVCEGLQREGSLPFLNASSHADYRSYYNERRRLVADHFPADVELFGYRFDSCVGADRP